MSGNQPVPAMDKVEADALWRSFVGGDHSGLIELSRTGVLLSHWSQEHLCDVLDGTWRLAPGVKRSRTMQRLQTVGSQRQLRSEHAQVTARLKADGIKGPAGRAWAELAGTHGVTTDQMDKALNPRRTTKEKLPPQ